MVEENFEGYVYYLEFQDEEGNNHYFVEEELFSLDGVNYAVLEEVYPEDSDDHAGQNDPVFALARVIKSDDGEEEYELMESEDPTFDKVVAYYENMLNEEA